MRKERRGTHRDDQDRRKDAHGERTGSCLGLNLIRQPERRPQWNVEDGGVVRDAHQVLILRPTKHTDWLLLRDAVLQNAEQTEEDGSLQQDR